MEIRSCLIWMQLCVRDRAAEIRLRKSGKPGSQEGPKEKAIRVWLRNADPIQTLCCRVLSLAEMRRQPSFAHTRLSQLPSYNSERLSCGMPFHYYSRNSGTRRLDAQTSEAGPSLKWVLLVFCGSEGKLAYPHLVSKPAMPA